MTTQVEQGSIPRATSARRRLWFAAALLAVLPLTVLLARQLWVAPFPINETVGILQDTGVLADTAQSPHTVLDPTLHSFFDPTTRSWYRPLYWLTWYVFWHATHSLDTTLLLFTLLEALTTTLLVVGFLWHVRPGSPAGAAAAALAVAVLVGMPGFRENLEVPLPMTLVGMLLALFVWMILERPHRRWHGPVLVLLTALAVGYKEQGLVLVPIIAAAWWVGAPGVRRTTVATIIVLTVGYLGMRFATAGSWRPFEQDVGIGFQAYSATEASARFGDFPYLVYAYNAAATVANILFSEPTSGNFIVVQRALENTLRPWQVVHVLTSVATTLLLAWWALRTWRARQQGESSPDFRLLVAAVIAVAASGALGFNYSRDRLAGMAVVFYALAVYSATRAAVGGLGPAGGWRLAAVVPLLLVSAGWQLRAVGTLDSVEARSVRTYREWVATRQEERRGHPSEHWRRIFDAMTPQGLQPVTERPPEYERWASRWLGTR